MEAEDGSLRFFFLPELLEFNSPSSQQKGSLQRVGRRDA